MSSKKTQDIKLLIKEQIKTKGTKEVHSPYAKYNSRGQLMCLVCGIPIKSAIIWQAHEKKRSHLEKITRLKDKQKQLNAPNIQSESITGIKSNGMQENKPKGILKNFTSYDSDEEDSEREIEQMEVDPAQKRIKIETHDQSSVESQDAGCPSKVVLLPNDPPAQNNSLPEGFFDDPVQDAKARKVEYRDKEAEEWLAFMKEVSAVEVESQQIIAEDKEEAAIETQIEQTNDQIRCLERVVKLDQEKKDQLEEKKNSSSAPMSDDSSDEEFSPVTWRTKNSLI